VPKLNKCIDREKITEMIGQRKDGFHFGYHTIFRCKIDGTICIGQNKCPAYKEWGESK
jgi:hypothetical protein